MTKADRTALLEADGISRREPNSGNWLLRDVDVTIECGSRLAIVGATGSGKTLLMRALARLDTIDGGEIRWKGRPICGDAIPHFRSEAIYLHQRPALFEGTVEDNLRLPFMLRCHSHREFSRGIVLGLLAQVNRNESFLERSSSALSGGEAQIVALLRAIQLQPKLLLLDEPTAALDDASTKLIEQLVSSWCDETSSERAFVWVSHDKQQVGRLADQVLVMRGGRLAAGVDQTGEHSP